jgi:hypothetical protein
MNNKVSQMDKLGKYVLLTALIGFALLTFFLSTSVLLDLFRMRIKQGNYVLFVVLANFLSSIFYFISAFAFISKRRWAVKPLLVSLAILIMAQIGFVIHINLDGLYETKTVGALIFRIILTTVFTLLIHRYSKKTNSGGQSIIQ